jgi:hypothetical protein
MAHQDVMDIAVLQRVIRREDRAAGIAEYGGNALLFETFPEYLRACLYHKIIHPEWV